MTIPVNYQLEKSMCLAYSLLLGICISLVNSHDIEKRHLLFTRSTVLQFSTGLTVPVVLPRRSINLSIVGQANYNLPFNVSNFYPATISARDKEKPSGYFDITRKRFYKYIIEFLENYDLDGEECLLRAICEIAEFPMHVKDEETLLEKVVHFVFTPSSELEPKFGNLTKSDDLNFNDRLLLAEKIGREDGDCDEEYSDCELSIVELFTAKILL